jgi:hypothetical protein
MQVDTGEWEAVAAQLAALLADVAELKAKTALHSVFLGRLAGGETPPPRHARPRPARPRPAWLAVVRGGREGGAA